MVLNSLPPRLAKLHLQLAGHEHAFLSHIFGFAGRVLSCFLEVLMVVGQCQDRPIGPAKSIWVQSWVSLHSSPPNNLFFLPFHFYRRVYTEVATADLPPTEVT